MAESMEDGSTEEMFRCPSCGDMFPTLGLDEEECPVCGTVCTRDECLALQASNEDF